MGHKVKLLLAFHCHQPVGNFDAVFEEAYEKAYLPFIDIISRHPSVKFSMHYSGSLLDWLIQHRPEFLVKIKHLVRSQQAEILAAGYYEPILPIIPKRDAAGQIEMFRDKICEVFDYEPFGSWLTERVWEPKLPLVLSESGIKYTIVDDSHFKLVSKDPEELSGYYYSDDESGSVAIFAGSEKLRYLMPFKLPADAIEYLRLRLSNAKNDLAITFADDGEKFGLWPGTYKWVYKEGWLDKFLSTLEQNSDWIKTETLSDYFNSNPATGRVYLPCASYREMMEWSGGYFRNFLIRYTEANNMHKKMLYVSNKIEGASGIKHEQIKQARQELYKGQANDAYWHGVFGGLYLNHLRSSNYSHLIEAEKIINQSLPNGSTAAEEVDFNLDGNSEVVLRDKQNALWFSPECQAALFEWDYLPRAINLNNTIMRRYEKYHEKLKAKAGSVPNETEGPLSIHDLSLVKGDLSKDMHYDSSPRYSLLERFLDSNAALNDFVGANLKDKGLFLNKKYGYKVVSANHKPMVKFSCSGRAENFALEMDKVIELDNGINVNYEIRNTDTRTFSSLFGIEFNLSIHDPKLSKQPGIIRDNRLIVNDSWYGLKLSFDFNREPVIWYFPVETVSESESGIEKAYQELSLLFQWEVNILPKLGWKMGMHINIEG